SWVSTGTPRPGPGQVVISVRAAAINYRDSLFAVGMVPEWMLADGMLGTGLGFECAGVISAVGEGVTHLRTGDRALAFASNSFASHVVADAALVGPLPGSFDFTEAVTMPVVFL